MPYSVITLDDPRRRSRVSTLFDPYDPKYRCCFRCCHIRLGVVLICAAELFASIVAVAVFVEHCASVYGGYKSPRSDLQIQTPANLLLEDDMFLLIGVIVTVALAVATVIAVTLTLWGISKNKRLFIVPHLIVETATALALLALIALFSLEVALVERGDAYWTRRRNQENGIYANSKPAYVGVLVLSLITLAAGLITQVYFIRVTYRCLQYFKRRCLYEQVAKFATEYGDDGVT